jgi:hypothetical protein
VVAFRSYDTGKGPGLSGRKGPRMSAMFGRGKGLACSEVGGALFLGRLAGVQRFSVHFRVVRSSGSLRILDVRVMRV